MTELDRIIRSMIEAEGPISVARYMQLALQHPDHGYYTKGDPLGVAGDFTTSPEISQLFGEIVGLWVADMWRRSCKPTPFVLLELGPGRGTMMQDALRGTQRVSGFHSAMKLMLMESNTTLRAQQVEKLGSYQPVYVEDLSALPPLPLFVVANEFFDALPVHQYIKTDQGWRERQVGLVDGALSFVESTQPALLPLPDSASFYEVSPQSVAMVQLLSAHIAAHGGGALIVDYGSAQEGGRDNTLQAVSGHVSVSALENAGCVDITAHVDFAALRIAAQKQAVFVPEIVAQGPFLHALGIDIRASQLKMKATPEQGAALDAAAKRLTDSSGMGALFKVLAIVPEGQKEVSGFS